MIKVLENYDSGSKIVVDKSINMEKKKSIDFSTIGFGYRLKADFFHIDI